jgi:hypothetical protein
MQILNIIASAVRFILRTVLALVLRSSLLGAGFATLLCVAWYILYGTTWIEFVAGFGFATAVVIIAVAMMWESYRLVSTSSAFEKAKSFAHQSGHLWAFAKAAELAIPVQIALENIDLGSSTWNSEYNAVLVDNVSREARELRRLANRSNW